MAVVLTGLALPLALGGVLPLDETLVDRWGAAGTWRLPVGHASELGRSPGPDVPAFKLNRGLERARGRITHQGADLADGRAGDTVHAAASGLVVLVYDGGDGNGYGGHVVLAHRLEDDELAYTVYAHLGRGTIVVKAGDAVCAGDPLARVGQTGRASTPHLHFEVRVPQDPAQRWEHAKVVDPIAFVESRFGEPASPDERPSVYVEWARHEALLPAEGDPDAPLTRGAWWRMLAVAARPGDLRPGSDPEQVRDGLIEAGLLPDEEINAPADERMSWTELARDVKRLRSARVVPPHGPLDADAHAAECEVRFGQRRPSAHTGALRHLVGDPTHTDACVLLADVSGPRAEVELRKAAAAKTKPKASRHGKAKPVKKKRGAATAGAAKPATTARGS